MGQGFIRNLEIDYVTPAGHLTPVEINATVLHGTGSLRILSLCRDISARKRAEEALREHQQMLSAIVESSQDWIWAMDLNRRHTYSNQAVEKILGYTTAEFRGMGLDLLHPQDRQMVEARWAGWLEPQQGWQNVVLRWRAKDGSYRYLESTAVPILGPQGEALGFRGVDRDITERERAEQALQDSEALYQSLVENLQQSVFRKDRAGRFTFANHRFCETIQRPLSNLLGLDDYDVFPRELAEKYRRDDEQVMATRQGIDSEESYRGADGKERTVQVVKTPLCDARGEVIGVQGVFWDITEKKQLEANYLRAQRQESIGALAAGIAHDLNNILTPILMAAPLLHATAGDNESRAMLGRSKPVPGAGPTSSSNCSPSPAADPARACLCLCAISSTKWPDSSRKLSPAISR